MRMIILQKRKNIQIIKIRYRVLKLNPITELQNYVNVIYNTQLLQLGIAHA